MLKKLFDTGFVFYLIFILWFIKPVNSMGVSELIPVDLQLLRGDSARFYFKVFALDSLSDQRCTYSISGIEPLQVTFDEEETRVEAGSVADIYGTVSVPEDTPIQSYSGKLTVSCASVVGVEGMTGSALKYNFNSGFSISVVTKAEERVAPQIPEVTQPAAIPYSAIITIIIIVILAIGAYYWSKKREEKKITFFKSD